MPDGRDLLLNYVRRGDVESFSAFVVLHAGWLKAYLRGLVSSEVEADDAFQDVWVKVIKSCGSYRGGSVRAYLTRVARSAVIDRFRRTGQPAVSLDAENDAGETLGNTLADAAPTADTAFETRSTGEDVRRAVRTLPPNQREVVMMRVEGELSFREIAEILGVPLGTALTWMHVATRRLRELLGENDEGNG